MRAMFRSFRVGLAALPLLAWEFSLAPRAAAEPVVATTEPRSPAEEQRGFTLPPGFTIELVAAEPEIHKPMNLKFDALGRLWVSHTIEYPFPATDPAKVRDAISVLSDFGPDGRARTIARFADTLNIPIGVVPLGVGNREAICWSIPHIWRLTDTDGDGVADRRAILFGPFGVTDTHGNQNAFTPWIDGWIYANHGFSNHSLARRGGDGPAVIEMQSGNTYRFRPDGARIESFAFGQVNPFGLTFDPRGDLYQRRLPLTGREHAASRRLLSKLRQAARRARLCARHDHHGSRRHRHFRRGISLGRATGRGVSRCAAGGQCDYEPRALRPAPLERQFPAGREGRGFCPLRRPLVSPGRHATRARRRDLHCRFLQSHHRAL